MFVRSFCAVLLVAFVCRAALPDCKLPGGNANTVHELRLQCTPCAFANQHCRRDVYLTLSLTIQNNTLVANDRSVFPASPVIRHGHFPAVRYWDTNSSREVQDVQVYYTLNIAQSIGHSTRQGKVKDLEMILFDTHWNVATPNPLYIILIQDANATLISDISVPQRKPTPALSQTKSTSVKVWVKYWRCQIGSYMIMAKEVAKALSSHSQPQTIPKLDHNIAPENKKHGQEQGQFLLYGHPNPRPETYHPHRPRPQKVSEYRPYRDDHTVPHILRPVLFPALLGTLAGSLAGMVGFVMGRIAVAAYFQRTPASVVRDEEEWDGERSV